MWPFNQEPKPGEFDLNRYQLTPDEQREIGIVFDTFCDPDGRRIGKEVHSEEVHRGLIAHGLWNYAEQKMVSADYFWREGREVHVNQAISSIKKAYAIYHLPIYTFDLARYEETIGRLVAAGDAYRAFLEAHTQYQLSEFDHLLLRDRDLGQAVRNAEERLGAL
jgi:hypothetical protein